MLYTVLRQRSCFAANPVHWSLNKCKSQLQKSIQLRHFYVRNRAPIVIGEEERETRAHTRTYAHLSNLLHTKKKKSNITCIGRLVKRHKMIKKYVNCMQWSLYAFVINAVEEILDIIEIMMNFPPTPIP